MHQLIVAPFVGAWIEITDGDGENKTVRSLRSSERGLKLLKTTQIFQIHRSLRLSERGLKLE